MKDNSPNTIKPEECSFCDFETTELDEFDAYGRTPGLGPGSPAEEKEWAWFCYVCQGTPVSNSFLYPRQYSEDVKIIGAALNYNTNLILTELKKRQNL